MSEWVTFDVPQVQARDLGFHLHYFDHDGGEHAEAFRCLPQAPVGALTELALGAIGKDMNVFVTAAQQTFVLRCVHPEQKPLLLRLFEGDETIIDADTLAAIFTHLFSVYTGGRVTRPFQSSSGLSPGSPNPLPVSTPSSSEIESPGTN